MRKKSHISLAGYLMNSEGMESLGHHKRSFYIGSVLPDCVPSFLVRKHTFEESFEVLKREIQKLVSHFDPKKGMDSYFYRHLGVITHYVSDYFTFPHNMNYPGKLKDHCIYEKHLKNELREYIKTPDAVKEGLGGTIKSPEAILVYVKKMHEIYLKTESAVKRDCEFIVTLCHNIVDAILLLFQKREAMAYFSISM